MMLFQVSQNLLVFIRWGTLFGFGRVLSGFRSETGKPVSSKFIYTIWISWGNWRDKFNRCALCTFHDINQLKI